jgi:AcrR family transcriptional regulator
VAKIEARDTAAPPRRGRPARISQDKIVEAAIELGLDTFTMQGIADRLGVTSPALYSHVAGRHQVLDLVSVALRKRLEGFASPATEWRDWLTDFAHLVRKHLAPSASMLIVDLRGSGTSDRVSLGERGLQLLIDAGMSPAEAGYSVWLVFRVAITARAANGPTLDGLVNDAGEVLRPETATDLPATHAVNNALAGRRAGDSFDFDLRIVLDGIARQLTGPCPAPTPRQDDP